jgi:hypothetical protein
MDGFFLAPLAPFLFVLGIIWLSNHRKLEEKRLTLAAERERADTAVHSSERIEELEERVRVLERIVTDGSYDLAHKIEALRDERIPDRRLAMPEPQRTTI